jgi:hypothetical protein
MASMTSSIAIAWLTIWRIASSSCPLTGSGARPDFGTIRDRPEAAP